jgi:hypothetical protein
VSKQIVELPTTISQTLDTCRILPGVRHQVELDDLRRTHIYSVRSLCMNGKNNFQSLLRYATICEILNISTPFPVTFSELQRHLISECRHHHAQMSLISESTTNSGSNLISQRKQLQRDFRQAFSFSLPL